MSGLTVGGRGVSTILAPFLQREKEPPRRDAFTQSHTSRIRAHKSRDPGWDPEWGINTPLWVCRAIPSQDTFRWENRRIRFREGWGQPQEKTQKGLGEANQTVPTVGLSLGKGRPCSIALAWHIADAH